jgi:hypothetical protein
MYPFTKLNDWLFALGGRGRFGQKPGNAGITDGGRSSVFPPWLKLEPSSFERVEGLQSNTITRKKRGKLWSRRVIFIKTFPSVVFVWAEQQAQTAKQLHHV